VQEDRHRFFKTIGTALKYLRLQKNLSIEQVSEVTGVSVEMIEAHEKGEPPFVAAADIVRLAKFLKDESTEFSDLLDSVESGLIALDDD